MRFRVTSVTDEEVAALLRDVTVCLEDTLNNLLGDRDFGNSIDQLTLVVVSVYDDEAGNSKWLKAHNRLGSFKDFVTSERKRYLSIGVSEVDVHLTLSTCWRTGPELDDDLTDEDVGYLCHSEGPFVGGGALAPQTSVLASLLIPGVSGTVKLVLPTVPFRQRNHESYVWGHERPHALRVSHVEVSAVRPETAEYDDG